MVVQLYTLEQFEEFIALPENADKLFELVAGEIVEKMPSNPYASVIAARIIHFIMLWIDANGMPGVVSGEAGGYMVDGERYAPDVAYTTNPNVAESGYNPTPPELAVEVETNVTAETEHRLRLKTSHYNHAGVTVWVVYPASKQVEVYTPDQGRQRLTINDTLNGGDVLPGFTLAISKIFA